MMQCYGLDYCNTNSKTHMFTHYMSSDISQTVILQNEVRRCHAAGRLQWKHTNNAEAIRIAEASSGPALRLAALLLLGKLPQPTCERRLPQLARDVASMQEWPWRRQQWQRRPRQRRPRSRPRRARARPRRLCSSSSRGHDRQVCRCQPQ